MPGFIAKLFGLRRRRPHFVRVAAEAAAQIKRVELEQQDHFLMRDLAELVAGGRMEADDAVPAIAWLVRHGNCERAVHASLMVAAAMAQSDELLAAMRARWNWPDIANGSDGVVPFLLFFHSDNARVEPVRWLLRHGASPLQPDPKTGNYPLCNAGTAEIAKALIAAGAPPDQLAGGKPASYWLTLRGSMEAVEAILDAGGDAALLVRWSEHCPLAGPKLADFLSPTAVLRRGRRPWYQAAVAGAPTASWAMGLLAAMGEMEPATS